MDSGAAKVRSRQIAVVRAAAVVQGLALVAIPTLSSVLTDPHRFALSATQYGALFLPQSAFAIAFSLAGGGLTQRFGIKRVLVAGFAADSVAMLLVAAGGALAARHPLSFVMLLVATAFLGAGFAVVTPALNILSGAFAPNAVDRAVLVTNALLGAASALAPVLLAVFVGLGVWWALPLLAGVAMLTLFGLGMRLPFAIAAPSGAASTAPMPARFWLFAGFALGYGWCEQMIGSWAPLYVTGHLHGAASFGLLALTLFWACAAIGRVAFAESSKVLPPPAVFCALPVVLCGAFVALARIPSGAEALAAAAFVCAGIGCSALLPLVISFSEQSIPGKATAVTSSVFAIYLIGYGLAAYGAGPLQRAGIGLPAMYGASAVLALGIAGLAFAITGARRGSARTPTAGGSS